MTSSSADEVAIAGKADTGPSKPNISLITLGGTISGTLDGAGRSVPTLVGNQLVEAVRGADSIAEVHQAGGRSVGSHALTLADLSWVSHLVNQEIADGADAVLITQGTDTLEETAYALALQVKARVPVVLTAAMRSAEEPGADGPANLLAALRVAAIPEVANLGPVVVIQDEIHLARWVTKLHTSKLAAFVSVGGAVGEVIEAEVRIHAQPASSDFLGLAPGLDGLDRRVEVVLATVGCDGTLVDAAAQHSAGIVVAAMGGGHATVEMLPALERAVKGGLPVVLASRCLDGPVLTRTYGAPGTERDLIELGLIPVGELSPLKARLRLIVALELGLPAVDVFPVG